MLVLRPPSRRIFTINRRIFSFNRGTPRFLSTNVQDEEKLKQKIQAVKKSIPNFEDQKSIWRVKQNLEEAKKLTDLFANASNFDELAAAVVFKIFFFFI